MNEKFFDLKKEKQDRILNAVLKVFAKNGYRKASTDEMVKEAGISKGLLFHYFGTKSGLYEFVCRYAVKYIGMELSGMLSGDRTDFFLLKKQIEAVKYQITRNFPYMPLFLQEMMRDTEGMDDALTAEVQEIQNSYRTLMEETLAPADFSSCAPYLNPTDLSCLTDYVIKGVMSENYSGDNEPSAEFAYERTISLLTMLSDLSRRE
ncbi:MAG: TetR/AcrR family transcriptional regulator [Clostridiales bacterium]|nr:TetR/AcrR family transcriptional regulator [Clostridiales bacterium]